MKRIHTTIITLLMVACFQSSVSAQEILSNESIINMVGAKVKKELIVSKIKDSKNKFDLSTQGLTNLKKGKVLDNIVEEMILATNPLPTLKNEDVIAMHKADISGGTILKMVQYSPSDYNTSTDALVTLKSEKIPDNITKAMMEPKNNGNLIAAGLPPHPQDLPAPDISKFSEAGVYYEQYVNGVSYMQIEPTTTNNTKSGDFGESVARSMTGGISGTTQRVGLANATSNNVIQDARPVFYFIFSGENRKDMNNVKESWDEGVASPNDFVLMKAKTTNRGREITIARSSAYTKETGFGQGSVGFRVKKVNNSIYKVYFEEDVAAGEYAFYYNKGSDQKRGLKLYDFSLQNNKKK